MRHVATSSRARLGRGGANKSKVAENSASRNRSRFARPVATDVAPPPPALRGPVLAPAACRPPSVARHPPHTVANHFVPKLRAWGCQWQFAQWGTDTPRRALAWGTEEERGIERGRGIWIEGDGERGRGTATRFRFACSTAAVLLSCIPAFQPFCVSTFLLLCVSVFY